MAELPHLHAQLEESDALIDRAAIMAEILAETGGDGMTVEELRAEASARLHARLERPIGAGALSLVPELPEFHSMLD